MSGVESMMASSSISESSKGVASLLYHFVDMKEMATFQVLMLSLIHGGILMIYMIYLFLERVKPVAFPFTNARGTFGAMSSTAIVCTCTREITSFSFFFFLWPRGKAEK